MMSVKRIVDWVNAYGSPIHIMDNEMLSIPLLQTWMGKCICLFLFII